MTHNLNPDRIVFCRMILNQWLMSYRNLVKCTPDELLAMSIAMEEVSMEIRKEAAEGETAN